MTNRQWLVGQRINQMTSQPRTCTCNCKDQFPLICPLVSISPFLLPFVNIHLEITFMCYFQLKYNLTSLFKSPSWAASRKNSLHSSVFSKPFVYLPQLFTFDIDACTLEILNNCSLRWGEDEALFNNSVPFIIVSFFTVPLG